MNSEARAIVSDYFNGSLKQQSAYHYIEKTMNEAVIAVTGSYSFGMQNETSDLDIEFIIPDSLHNTIVEMAGGIQHVWVHDEIHHPLIDIKVRPLTWLQNRLSGDNPEVLWIYQHACCIQDHNSELPQLIEDANTQFQSINKELLTKHYKDFRTGVTLSASREPLGEIITMTRAIDAALALPFLSRNEPYPYPKWKSSWLKAKHKQGELIVSLCGRWLAGEPVYEQLRDVLNSIMIEAGHRDLIKHFWRKV
ncbi:hypothetical protein [Paenibacillus sp. RC67]|uniref:hypothetical protein n=1 Tax=Paenibacillus sp. RC67 TaxID=3039392 RepID=UPI0024ADBECD|nr:hypothetical protein [Paenibacillus sp. RC67]